METLQHTTHSYKVVVHPLARAHGDEKLRSTRVGSFVGKAHNATGNETKIQSETLVWDDTGLVQRRRRVRARAVHHVTALNPPVFHQAVDGAAFVMHCVGTGAHPHAQLGEVLHRLGAQLVKSIHCQNQK